MFLTVAIVLVTVAATIFLADLTKETVLVTEELDKTLRADLIKVAVDVEAMVNVLAKAFRILTVDVLVIVKNLLTALTKLTVDVTDVADSIFKVALIKVDVVLLVTVRADLTTALQ